MWHSKKDKIYYVVTDFTIDKSSIRYFVECVLLMDVYDLDVKIDQIKIEKLEGE